MSNGKEKQTTTKTTSTAITKKKDTAISKAVPNLTQLEVFELLAKSANTGISNAGEAFLMKMKAEELGVGFGNAIPHMHVINGKPGIDIHIIKAILSRPSAYTKWECVKDYEPVYQLITQEKYIINSNEIPKEVTLKIVPLANIMKAVANDDETIAAYIVKDGKRMVVDYETQYIFTRVKPGLDGVPYEVTSSKGYFTWNLAKEAGLPYDKGGQANPNSAWTKYRKLMVDIRAFTFGARDIASDLLMGNYESSELFDIHNVDYAVEDTGDDPNIIRINNDNN